MDRHPALQPSIEQRCQNRWFPQLQPRMILSSSASLHHHYHRHHHILHWDCIYVCVCVVCDCCGRSDGCFCGGCCCCCCCSHQDSQSWGTKMFFFSVHLSFSRVNVRSGFWVLWDLRILPFLVHCLTWSFPLLHGVPHSRSAPSKFGLSTSRKDMCTEVVRFS